MDKLSIIEYQSIEKESGQRYEYHDGDIFALAGGSFAHGLLSLKLQSLGIEIPLGDLYFDIEMK